MAPQHTNHLANEQSPYLLQHAHNPVKWYPWNDAAFEKAQSENKPIFLSIGYSTCHWCHVMENESFEDEHVARLMNEAFVSIKVDREERPDIDNVYMTVCQMMTGSGGWPLTIIMTPDKKPFFTATYIPKESRFGRTGMLDLIPKVNELWDTQRERVLESAEQWSQNLAHVAPKASQVPLSEELLEATFHDLQQRYEPRYGGFGQAPKFPAPHNLLFLLRYYQRTDSEQVLKMVETTLQHMRRGGIYDQIGYGFHRYSTDAQWLVPHFEKMLYDQAMLIMAYSEAYQLTRNEEYAQTAREVIEYVMRDMTSPQGGFYSAEDADSEGEEGKFYVWSETEIRDILNDDADWFIRLFGVESNGNYKDEATHRLTGKNILHLRQPIDVFAEQVQQSPEEMRTKIQHAREQLVAAREQRVHPLKDDKILTDWNGLMIAALAQAGTMLQDQTFIKVAERAAAFIMQNMTDPHGRLYHRFRGEEAAIPGFIDDYAFMVWGLLNLFEATQNVDYLEHALTWNENLLTHFGDAEQGGFFSTPNDGESLLVRTKESYDGAIPSGNSVAMLNLLRLARLTGRTELEDVASKLGQAFASQVAQAPSAYTFMMSALTFAVGPAFEIVIVGSKQDDKTHAFFNALHKVFLPNKVVVLRTDDMESSDIDRYSSFVKSLERIDSHPTAYVCQNFACHMPTTDVDNMIKLVEDAL